jgi:GST-like protein
MLTSMELQLARSEFLAGDQYTIADILGYPVAAVSMKRHPGNFDAHPHIARWVAAIAARPAVQRGMKVPQ